MDTNRREFTKEEAIKKMLDGYRVIECSIASKREYRGEFCTYGQAKFYRLKPTALEPLDTNQMINKYWEYASLVPAMIPPTLFKTNLKLGVVIELTYTKILKTGIDRGKNNWAIVAYDGSDGNPYSVNMTHEMGRHATLKPILNNFLMTFEQESIEYSRKSANFQLKYFVEQQTAQQRKRHISKPELKTMTTVRAIIANHPEALV